MNVNRIIDRLLRMRDPRKRNQAIIIYVLVAVVAAGGWFLNRRDNGANGNGARAGAPLPANGINARCIRVIDGDTIEVNLGKEHGRDTVRILGIDTMEPYNEDKRAIQAKRLQTSDKHVLRMAKWASREMTERLLKQELRLVFSSQSPRRDPHQRLLAYVEINGEDAGATLLKAGLAEARREPHDRRDNYRAINEDARRSRRGIYGTPQF